MISCSSSLASSAPATSLNVTFFCVLDESFARLLPNDRALFPPLCICRMMKTQKPIISRIGAQDSRIVVQAPAVSVSRRHDDLAQDQVVDQVLVRRAASSSGTLVVARRRTNLPVISLPTNVTSATCPVFTRSRKSENVMSWLLVWRFRRTARSAPG